MKMKRAVKLINNDKKSRNFEEQKEEMPSLSRHIRS